VCPVPLALLLLWLNARSVPSYSPFIQYEGWWNFTTESVASGWSNYNSSFAIDFFGTAIYVIASVDPGDFWRGGTLSMSLDGVTRDYNASQLPDIQNNIHDKDNDIWYAESGLTLEWHHFNMSMEYPAESKKENAYGFMFNLETVNVTTGDGLSRSVDAYDPLRTCIRMYDMTPYIAARRPPLPKSTIHRPISPTSHSAAYGP
jgi:hypothetical protein